MNSNKKIKIFLEALQAYEKAHKKGLISIDPYDQTIQLKDKVFDELFPVKLYNRKNSVSGSYIRKEVGIAGGIKFMALFDVEQYINVEDIDRKF